MRYSWIHFLPSLIQKTLFSWTGLEQRVMPFHVQPGSTWLGYEITNPDWIQAQLPPHLELAPISVLNNMPPTQLLFFNFFHVDSFFLSGHRLEFVTVAQHTLTGKYHFVILDYISDTISSDPTHFFRGPSSSDMKLCYHDTFHYCSVEDEFFLYHKHHWNNELQPINRTFSVECNEEIFYGSSLNHTPNKLWFSERETSEVITFKPSHVFNPYYTRVRARSPLLAFYYPHEIVFTILMGKQPFSS